VTVDELLAKARAVLEPRANIRFALLFGSAATKGPDGARDIDIALSFDSSPGLLDLAELAQEIEVAVGHEVDLVEIDEASTLLRWEVVRDGRVIVAHDKDALLELQARVPIEYADLRPYFERESEGLRRALSGGRG
jgi:predicted nucleotidyltransferase